METSDCSSKTESTDDVNPVNNFNCKSGSEPPYKKACAARLLVESDYTATNGNGMDYGGRDTELRQQSTILAATLEDEKIGRMRRNCRLFNDPVHRNMELPRLCVLVLDTPVFQRLRRISQTGTCNLVYPAACHTRFEHSLGTCFLASRLVLTLYDILKLSESTQRGRIRLKEILCVCIAALCHDLGHGPLSHLFDVLFLAKIAPNKRWKHEKGSLLMFDYLLKENPEVEARLRALDEDGGGLDDQDFVFIRELIAGPLDWLDNPPASSTDITADNWPYRGRPAAYSFLYEIVSNPFTGVDVDKMEYFARDSHQLHLSTTFDHERFMRMVEVVWGTSDRLWHIAVRDKEIWNMYQMFLTRACLHRNAYQHKVNVAASIMVNDALVAADEFLLFEDSAGNMVPLSKTIEDVVAFKKTDDSVISRIINHPTSPAVLARLYPDLATDSKGRVIDPRLAQLGKAQHILQRLETRNFYTFLGESINANDGDRSFKMGFQSDFVAAITAVANRMDSVVVDRDDFEIYVSVNDFGKKNRDPVLGLWFCLKNKETMFQIRGPEDASWMLPKVVSESVVRLYARTQNPDKQAILAKAFKKWCSDEGLKLPMLEDGIFTPAKDGSSQGFSQGTSGSFEGVDLRDSATPPFP